MLRAFTQRGAAPKATVPLVLASVTVAVLAMSVDEVARYSHDAFFAGLGLTIVLALAVGTTVDTLKNSPWRTAAMLGLPAVFGACIGMIVQALVLQDVGSSLIFAVKDLQGLVDTTQPVPWILGGIVLGAVPALAVAIFLLLASRAIRRIGGHDASESFGVAFTGGGGLLAALALSLVDGIATPPLLVVTIVSALTVLVAMLVDGARVRFLRHVYSGHGDGYDIVSAERFASDSSLAPMVASAGASAVLVRVETRVGSYRDAAAVPIALLGEDETSTLRPLQRRRVAAAAMLLVMGALSAVAVFSHL